ncbi:MAG TPA: c-type cytochrome [Steroidobacteraceae bacterium]|nr:c-type cytochrome [Steroidobacteraceae bacterium]
MPRSTEERARRSLRRAAARALLLSLAALSPALSLLAALPAAAQGPQGSLAAGREKYVECASCHGSDGRSTVMPAYPKIGGQSAVYVVNALKAYRDGRRQGTYASMMAQVAKGLSDADIVNLAAYVESLEPSQ